MDKGISHFRSLLSETVQELENNCKRWEVLCTEDGLSEEVLGEIRTAIGLTKLLLNQKLKQFSGLIDDSEFKRSEKEITCVDLAGFWDMLSFEVEKVKNNFSALEKCKMNNWEVSKEGTDQPVVKKKLVPSISVKQVTSSKSLAIAARQRIAEAKQRMRQQQLLKQNANEFVVEIVNSTNQLTNGVPNEKEASKLSENSDSECNQNVKLSSGKEVSKSEDISHSLKEANFRNSGKTSRKAKKDNEIDNFGKENKLTVPRSKRNVKVAETDKENTTVPSMKKANKPRDYGKLQCVTRSAARLLLAEKNSH